MFILQTALCSSRCSFVSHQPVGGNQAKGVGTISTGGPAKFQDVQGGRRAGKGDGGGG